jgi:transposase
MDSSIKCGHASKLQITEENSFFTWPSERIAMVRLKTEKEHLTTAMYASWKICMDETNKEQREN